MIDKQLKSYRYGLLMQIEHLVEKPAIFLAFVWLILLLLEFTQGLSRELEWLSISIWIFFIIEFIVKIIIAPEKGMFLKRNILTLLSLLIPAIRAVRIFSVARFFRTIRLAKVIGTLNRSLKSLNRIMKHRAVGFVFLFSMVVLFAGAAGMHAFEKETGHLATYGESIWWTAMLLITIGSDYWPLTPEGRMLAFIIAFYGFTVLGYITATIASLFIEQDSGNLTRKHFAELMREIRELRKKLDEKNQI